MRDVSCGGARQQLSGAQCSVVGPNISQWWGSTNVSVVALQRLNLLHSRCVMSLMFLGYNIITIPVQTALSLLDQNIWVDI